MDHGMPLVTHRPRAHNQSTSHLPLQSHTTLKELRGIRTRLLRPVVRHSEWYADTRSFILIWPLKVSRHSQGPMLISHLSHQRPHAKEGEIGRVELTTISPPTPLGSGSAHLDLESDPPHDFHVPPYHAIHRSGLANSHSVDVRRLASPPQHPASLNLTLASPMRIPAPQP